MSRVIEDSERVKVELTQAELNTLLIGPATEAGFIDFVPTRIATAYTKNGVWEITFERVEDGRTRMASGGVRDAASTP